MPAFEQCLDERLGRAVDTGELYPADFDNDVIDPQAGQRTHDMFTGFDRGIADFKRGAAVAFGHVLNQCGDAGRRTTLGEVGAVEHDAVVDRGGLEADGGLVASEQPASADSRGLGDGSLVGGLDLRHEIEDWFKDQPSRLLVNPSW